MSDWPSMLSAAAERITGVQRDAASDPAPQLARRAAELGDRATVDELWKSARPDAASDPVGIERRTYAAAFQRLDDASAADRIIATIEDPNARWAACAGLLHAAVAAGQQERAGELARDLATQPPPMGDEFTAVRALAAGATAPATAAAVVEVAERAARSLRTDQDEAMVFVARLRLTAGDRDAALTLAHSVAKRTSRDGNASWYVTLARVLVDAGDEEGGEALLERVVRWYEQRRTAASAARAALVLARWGRNADAQYLLTNQAEPRLESIDDAATADSVRVILVETYLALDEVAIAIEVASEITEPADRARALRTIADHSRTHHVALTPEIAEVLTKTGLDTSP